MRYEGENVAEVLGLSVEHRAAFLSGGEDHRVQLAGELREVERGTHDGCFFHAIRAAGPVVDLRQEAGEDDGRLTAGGTPQQMAACEASRTGKALAALLSPHA